MGGGTNPRQGLSSTTPFLRAALRDANVLAGAGAWHRRPHNGPPRAAPRRPSLAEPAHPGRSPRAHWPKQSLVFVSTRLARRAERRSRRHAPSSSRATFKAGGCRLAYQDHRRGTQTIGPPPKIKMYTLRVPPPQHQFNLYYCVSHTGPLPAPTTRRRLRESQLKNPTRQL